MIGEILGGAGNDRILSGLNNDIIRGGIGADFMDGGVGIDTASYEGDTLGVRVSLNRGKGYGPLSGEANGDTLVNIENLIGGSGNDRLFGDVNDNDIRGGSGNDFMSGQEGNDVLYGNNGSDTIFGRLGDDVIVGGAGDDVLEGGSGSDLFVFETFIASRFDGPAERDIINDYTVGVDGLDLAEVFNNSGTEMIFLGTSGFTGTNGEVRYGRNFSRNQTTVQVDTDGDSIADLVIVLKNTTAALSILDFEF